MKEIQEIHSEKISNANPVVKKYVEDSVEVAVGILGENLVSIQLFGSGVKNDFSEEISDVDLIFVVEGGVKEDHLRKLEKRIKNLEIRYNLSKPDDSKFLSIISSRTGVFRSYFVFSLENLKNMDFSALFEEGKLFDLPLGSIVYSLTPFKLIFHNMLKESITVYGEQIANEVDIPLPSNTDFAKNYFGCLLLSVFSAMFSLTSSSGTLFSLEALKWYLIGAYTRESKEIADINSSIEYIISEENLLSPLILNKFLSLRDEYSREFLFSLSVPLYLFYIQVALTLKN